MILLYEYDGSPNTKKSLLNSSNFGPNYKAGIFFGFEISRISEGFTFGVKAFLFGHKKYQKFTLFRKPQKFLSLLGQQWWKIWIFFVAPRACFVRPFTNSHFNAKYIQIKIFCSQFFLQNGFVNFGLNNVHNDWEANLSSGEISKPPEWGELYLERYWYLREGGFVFWKGVNSLSLVLVLYW